MLSEYLNDVGHVIYGCDTGMYDELKILPLFWWTSECTFETYLKMKDSPAVDVMYADMIKEKGVLWLYGAVLKVLPTLIPALIPIWFKTRKRIKLLPFLEFEPLLDRSLLDIRQEFDLLEINAPCPTCIAKRRIRKSAECFWAECETCNNSDLYWENILPK